MPSSIDDIRFREPRTLLLYSPLQFAPGETTKPDGSLSLIYLAGALRRASFEVRILDCAVGDERNSLSQTFFRQTRSPNGLLQVGLAEDAILSAVEPWDVIGISSIFTTQSKAVLETVRLIKRAFPDKLIVAGGVNARSLRQRFFDSGVDVIALSEGEDTIVDIVRAVQGKDILSNVSGIAFRNEHGREKVNPAPPPLQDLDRLPMPAWDLLPLDKYWEISRPHGGHFPSGQRLRYASLQTSRGCPFRCSYCHISQERDGSMSGPIGHLRLKSAERVIQELETLKGLGVEYVFFEDDSLLAKKQRAKDLFTLTKDLGLTLLDVNGINVCHFQKNKNGRLEVDSECIEILADAGFQFISLPFESANQRIIDKYASSKWRVDLIKCGELIRAFSAANIRVSGNYMLGFPDETEEEIYQTVLMAKRHMDDGLDYALFFSVVPFPGTMLFDLVIANGQLDADFDTDSMRWTSSVIKNLAVSGEVLECIRKTAWLTVNRREYVEHKRQMTMVDTAVAS
jgi:anaerobic magnesium-protoporphyrin IX monomethyl ester cyclase